MYTIIDTSFSYTKNDEIGSRYVYFDKAITFNNLEKAKAYIHQSANYLKSHSESNTDLEYYGNFELLKGNGDNLSGTVYARYKYNYGLGLYCVFDYLT